MANSTSKTTKAKTKTTKKTVAATKPVAAKAIKQPTKAARTPLKTTSKKVVGNEVGSSAISREDVNKRVTGGAAAFRGFMARAVTAEGIRRLYLISTVVFILLAVLAAAFMNETASQLLRGHLTADTLASQGQTVFGPAQHVISSLEVRWLTVITLLVSAALTAWRYQNVVRERQALADHIAPWRWVDLALTGALIMQVIAFLSGMQEVVSLMLLGAMVAASAVFAWIAERENAGSKTIVRGALTASFVTGALTFLALNSYAVATPVYGMVRSPWYVYALYALVIAVAVALVLIQIRQYKRLGNWANYAYVERGYAVLNLVAKVLFAVILIVGLHK